MNSTERGGRLVRRLPVMLLMVAALFAGMGLVGCEGSAQGPTPMPTRTLEAVTPAAAATVPASPGTTPSPSALPSASATATPTEPPTATPTEKPTETPTAAQAQEDGPSGGGSALLRATPVANSGSAFEDRIWVGLYGVAGSRGLGILGTASATATVTMTRQHALAYQELLTDTEVVPVFHMVVTIADPFPGPRGDYVHHSPTPTLQSWIDIARDHGVKSVLDIQPGHSPITVELGFVEPFVRQQGVHLAIDPEFLMVAPGDIPGRRIGRMTGAQVNLVQAWLNDIAEAVGERKVLVIHQFVDRMFSGKEDLRAYPLVDLVWNADGFGGPGPKIYNYRQYAGEPGFQYGGFKLFYDYDKPLMSPADVLRLEPRPVFITYH